MLLPTVNWQYRNLHWPDELQQGIIGNEDEKVEYRNRDAISLFKRTNPTRIQDDVARFKVALKKCNLEQISFMKGTCVNLNKFRWFLLLLIFNF